MGNRYSYQFNASLKPKMSQIEGFVSIGTGGLLNYPPAYPIVPVATGATGTLGQTGAPLGLMPGQATAGVPTGWQGGFSGAVGLIGAGLDGIQRVGTGLYALQLSDDWVRLDGATINLFAGASGGVPTGGVTPGYSGMFQQDMGWYIKDHTIGLGNSIVTGGMTLPVFPGGNPKNRIYLQFTQGSAPADLANSSGFWIDLRVRDSLSGVQ